VCDLDLHQKHSAHWQARVIGYCQLSRVVELELLQDLQIFTQEFVSHFIRVSEHLLTNFAGMY
jgi:hypothetical protein